LERAVVRKGPDVVKTYQTHRSRVAQNQRPFVGNCPLIVERIREATEGCKTVDGQAPRAADAQRGRRLDMHRFGRGRGADGGLYTSGTGNDHVERCRGHAIIPVTRRVPVGAAGARPVGGLGHQGGGRYWKCD